MYTMSLIHISAGLYAALNLPEDINALLVSKKELTLSNSSLAQGGVAAVLDLSLIHI